MMPFSSSLAARVRDAVGALPGLDEKKMFGGLCFLVHGHMLVGVWKDSLIARIGPDAKTDALAQPGVEEFDITGRPMKGWVLVTPDAMESDRALHRWIELAQTFVRTLPPKT